MSLEGSHRTTPDLSLVIPAFNEERCLGETIDAILASIDRLRRERAETVELIVVDNGSTDRTSQIACERGAVVVTELDHGIGRARNVGAAHATSRLLVFVDADTLVAPDFPTAVSRTMADPRCIAGAVDTDYRPRRWIIRAYLAGWRLLGRLTHMAQGVRSSALREAFLAVRGYDERLFMGEDVDFFWRMRRYARKSGGVTRIITATRVRPSTRRFDKWPLWRVVLMTNPLVILLFRRRRAAWSGWYEGALR